MGLFRGPFSPTRLAIGVVLVMAFVVGSALAAGGGKTKSKTVTLASDEQGSATAKCPKGSKAISGGFEVEAEPEGPDPTPFVRLISSKRAGARGWSAAGFNAEEAAPGDLTSFAYCSALKVQRASATVSVAEDEVGTATAKCPRGSKVLSGGFQAEPVGDASGVRVTGSRKVGKRRWEISGNGINDSGHALTAYAHCREGKGLKSKQVSEAVPQSSVEELKAKCQRGQRVVSGGFEAPEPVGFVAGSVPLASRKLSRRTWGVTALGLNEETVTAYAYCEKTR